MRDRYDVIVVGARVGGSTLTALLGDAGVSVLLLDRARFPSTTCSTHFFRGAGMVGVLERLGVLDAVLDLGCPPLTRELNYADGGTEPREAPPQDPGTIGYCLSVRREPLDFILLERARVADSVDFAERTSVSDLLWNGDRVVGVQLADGRSAHAEIVVGADGRHSLVARKVTPAMEHETPPYRALYYRYVSGFLGRDGAQRDAAEFSILDDEIAYTFPSDSGLTCVAVSVNLETFRWLRQDFEARYAERIAQHRGLARRVAAAEADGRLSGCGPERNYVRVPWARAGRSSVTPPCTRTRGAGVGSTWQSNTRWRLRCTCTDTPSTAALRRCTRKRPAGRPGRRGRCPNRDIVNALNNNPQRTPIDAKAEGTLRRACRARWKRHAAARTVGVHAAE